MARGFNKSIIMGNLARDPDIRYTTSKQAVAKFTVAVNRQWKNKDGEVQDDCDFIPVVVWGAAAENAERFLKKGSQVLVEGRIQVRKYENQQGVTVWMTEIVASNVVYLSKPKTDDSASEFHAPGKTEAPADPADPGIDTFGDDDDVDIPF